MFSVGSCWHYITCCLPSPSCPSQTSLRLLLNAPQSAPTKTFVFAWPPWVHLVQLQGFKNEAVQMDRYRLRDEELLEEIIPFDPTVASPFPVHGNMSPTTVTSSIAPSFICLFFHRLATSICQGAWREEVLREEGCGLWRKSSLYHSLSLALSYIPHSFILD